MALTPAEQKVCENLDLTEEEYLATRLGVTPDAYRATKAAKALTPLQLEAAKRMGITPERYAAHVEPVEEGE